MGASKVVGTGRAAAVEVGLEYLTALQLATEGVAAVPLSTTAWSVSMHVLTVATVKRATADGLTLAVAGALAQRRSLGSATRRMLDAQRSVVAQGAIHGYKRVSAGKPDCDFCAMLIGRGAVYDEDSGDFKSHDWCDCLLQPERS